MHTYTQYFFNVIAAAIPVIRQVAGDQELGVLLQTIEGQTQKSCDSDFGRAFMPLDTVDWQN